MQKYIVLAKYISKYGVILYCTKVKSESDLDVDMNNVYINTLYYKGKDDIKVGSLYDFSTVKGENGLTYCF